MADSTSVLVGNITDYISKDGLKNSFWEGVMGDGLVCCEPADHPFFQSILMSQVAVILFILFFKYSWCKIASGARNRINSVTQAGQ